MSDTIERFSNRVENYVKYRPDYPKEVLDLFRKEMNLQTSSVVADIGTGTGISAKLFLENGNTVFGIEPNAAMRVAAENYLQDFPNFKNVKGTAEETSLENKTVDFIVAAQAFHWFDKEKTREEFKRILKDKGFVVLMWNERQLDSTEFLRGYECLLIEYGTDYEKVRHENITKEILQDFLQTNFRQAIFQNAQTLDFSGLKGRMLSSSYMPTAENPRFSEMLKNLESLFAEHSEKGKIQILYNTNVFYAQF
ncbi:MAG: class I SAM-dependent methyltransferase [Acidobacteria bacterium]|nr:class I SAM-dependent methyltransferase [Acidobacteriota bacterium]MCA1636783.1 class I SAM-dependent methyltransferase [Acidobacteriota bacterium]